ncbi:hypothetical protein SDC9_13578 [bioreactor metagenome]|uniref:Uncharacterized protein n=1 Tax=bioreactor metagenome TaxID=1076179 RepID=A0A644TLM6_9ZZZZ|nr:EAL domain-containing protein [Negativicutes bacterium]
MKEICPKIDGLTDLAEAKLYIKKLETVIAEQQANKHVLREERQKHEAIINNLQEVVFQTDKDGCWTFLNPVWADITGFTVEESIGKHFLEYVYPADRASQQGLLESMVQKKLESCRYELRYCHKDGGFCWVEVSARLALDEDRQTCICGTLTDISERKKLEFELNRHRNELEELVNERTYALYQTNEQLKQEVADRCRSEAMLEYLETHDSLTNLPNRYFLTEALCKASAAASPQHPSALIFVDIDNFKVVNDTFGHSDGDKLLVSLVSLFKRDLEQKDVLARLGGDEFGVLLHNADIDKATKVAERFRRLLDEGELCIDTQRVCLNLTISVGVVLIDGTLETQDLMAYAETALYAAKEEGKNRISVIESANDKAKFSEANIMVGKIKAGLKEQRFELHFQPVYKFGEGIAHYEALIRLRDEDETLLPPNHFIPIAERFGLMSQIDRWVVKSVIKILQNRRDDIRLFLNLSGTSLGDKALLSFIEHIIKKSGVAAERIGFEITETTAVKDLEQAEEWIKRIKDLGCCFALDDFGIGFSSFSYLSALPVDYIKIDGSFVQKIDVDSKQLALVQAMNAVTHTLGKKTIAEFVENEKIANILHEIGVDCGQGYYFGKPAPLCD